MVPITLTAAMITAADDNIAQSQTPGAAGYLTLNGTAVSGGVATLATSGGGLVIITSGGNDTGKTFTLTGTDPNGLPITESFAGASGGAATSTKYYKTISAVYVNAATAGTVKVGTSGVGASRWATMDTYVGPANISVAATVSGTVNYSMQYTFDDLGNTQTPTAWTDATVVSKTAAQSGSIAIPVTGVRILINSGTGTVTMKVIQSGLPLGLK